MYATSVCRMPIIVQVENAVYVLSSEKTTKYEHEGTAQLNYDIENANVRYTTHPHKHKHTTDFMPIIISPYLCASLLPLRDDRETPDDRTIFAVSCDVRNSQLYMLIVCA